MYGGFSVTVEVVVVVGSIVSTLETEVDVADDVILLDDVGEIVGDVDLGWTEPDMDVMTSFPVEPRPVVVDDSVVPISVPVVVPVILLPVVTTWPPWSISFSCLWFWIRKTPIFPNGTTSGCGAGDVPTWFIPEVPIVLPVLPSVTVPVSGIGPDDVDIGLLLVVVATVV